MKKVLSIFLAVMLVLSMSTISVFANIQDDIENLGDQTVLYVKNGATFTNSGSIVGGTTYIENGPLTISGGNRPLGDLIMVDNDAEITFLENVENNATINIERYAAEEKGFKPYTFDRSNIPGADFFAGNSFSTGTDIVSVGWSEGSWGNNYTFTSPYTIDEDIYVDQLSTGWGLELNIYVPEGEVRVIRANTLTLAGPLNITGGGKVVFYIDQLSDGNNGGLINATGDPSKLTFVFTNPNKTVIRNFPAISANIISTSKELDISVANINGTIYSNGDINFVQNGNITGLVYAPDSNVSVGNSSSIYGMTVCDTAIADGSGKFILGEATFVDDDILNVVTDPENPEPEPTEEPKPTEEPIPTEPPVDQRAKVVRYDVLTQEYSLGIMDTMYHTPTGHEYLTYEVLNEGTYEITGVQDIPNYDIVKADVQYILRQTQEVIDVDPEGRVVVDRYGRIDSNGTDSSLVITPYVTPNLGIDTMWLAVGDRAGKITTVWMVIE